MTLPYTTPAAFRRALTERLRAAAKPNGPWPLAELQRQFAYDRLLARLYHLDSGWLVKGATALLARELAVRRTVDIPLPTTTLDGALAIAGPLLDPLLDETAAGTWNPRTASWGPTP
ncbi:hypothetical protein ACFQZ2_00580 [Streptomonospora algeriensis]|uniref:Uncharacterized protein n=1 Tax=Streptomonospora algeriensis TaxID=995084 RepID=A0ABW3BAN3_9ACTN